MSTEWPYDAPQDDPLTAHRIPIVGEYSRWMYIVWFDDTSPVRPDDRETALLNSFLTEYIEHWYTASYKAQLRTRPFDIDGGANGVGFIKYAEGSWGYRRRSWGHSYRPVAMRTYTRDGQFERQPVDNPLALADLMDQIQGYGPGTRNPRWEQWKAAHPEVFGRVAS